jgi:hypothetical protein
MAEALLPLTAPSEAQRAHALECFATVEGATRLKMVMVEQLFNFKEVTHVGHTVVTLFHPLWHSYQ